ncbi:hypothetical protein [Nocardiopsis ganjiahuensis]|uniref:hypothetical protein n=1 Tax=Nocardiopsis ganjiahuensis TaxID=239984 RepID=UPI00034C4077|nr:hypothetical protein [Nocardiopsis ganjiahuensis]
MSELLRVTQNMQQAIGGNDEERLGEVTMYFTETLTFATADEIVALLEHERRHGHEHGFPGLPEWAVTLAYRLACLQRPDDPALLREAAAALLRIGPVRDGHAEELKRRADLLESEARTGEGD